MRCENADSKSPFTTVTLVEKSQLSRGIFKQITGGKDCREKDDDEMNKAVAKAYIGSCQMQEGLSRLNINNHHPASKSIDAM